MKTQDKKELNRKIDYEGGLEATLIHYGNFEEIKDEKFHELRNAFEMSYNELADYIGWNDYTGCEEDED